MCQRTAMVNMRDSKASTRLARYGLPRLVIARCTHIDVGEGDVCDLEPPERRYDLGGDLLPVCCLRRWPLAEQILELKACAEIGNSGRCAIGNDVAERVATTIDLPL